MCVCVCVIACAYSCGRSWLTRLSHRLRDEETSAGVEGEGQGTGMQKWAKASLRDLGRMASPVPRLGDLCAAGTKSSDLTHQSHPTLLRAEPHDLGQ